MEYGLIAERLGHSYSKEIHEMLGGYTYELKEIPAEGLDAFMKARDFKGINEKFDGKGNYTLGVTEQIIFPEIDIDKITKIFGMEITFVTSAKTDEEAYALLREFGLPFKNAKKNQ